VPSDLIFLADLQFALALLGVVLEVVVVLDRSGVEVFAVGVTTMGLIDNWLRHVQDVARQHAATLAALPPGSMQARRLCELNVIEQVMHVAQTTVVEDAWGRGQSLAIHGWVYDIGDGLLQDLDVSVAAPDEREPAYARACQARGS
jgi:carbonic anhydrase